MHFNTSCAILIRRRERCILALFNIPKRKEEDIHKAISKAREEAEYKPKIKLKGTSLLNKLDVIKQTVEQNLGNTRIVKFAYH